LPNAPILVWALGDPVEEGVAKSFVRPGLNITGLVQPLREAASKQVEILRRFVPDLSGIAIFQGAKRDADDERFYRFVEAIARDASMNATFATPSSWDEVHSAFRSLRSRGFQAAIWATNPPGSTKGIVRLAREAIDARVALVDYFDHLADRGFLACYGEQDQDLYLRFAQQLDRILRAGSASDIPFMNPSRYHLRVNLRTAAELRLAVPAEIRVMADRLVS
jgi:putative ABC transport system substrate-binding protein